VRNLKQLPLVSIIIPTHNSERTLRECLQSIRMQTYRRVETIVVDNFSTEKTVHIAGQFKATILSSKSERSAARNLGAAKAIGDFLLFIDSDMKLCTSTIEESLRLCLEKDLGAVAIPEKTVATGFLGRCRKLERELYDSDPNSYLMPRLFSKEAFLAVEGFDERLNCGEDFDLARRLESQGYEIGLTKSTIDHLEGSLSLRKAVLKAHSYGRKVVPFFSKEPTLALKEYCPTRFAWNIKRLLNQPTCLLGLAMLKLFEYIAYFIGILSALIAEMRLVRNAQ